MADTDTTDSRASQAQPASAAYPASGSQPVSAQQSGFISGQPPLPAFEALPTVQPEPACNDGSTLSTSQDFEGLRNRHHPSAMADLARSTSSNESNKGQGPTARSGSDSSLTPVASSSTSSAANQHKEHGHSCIMECNICLESAQEPVVTLCGHVFCWPCIYTWMEQSGNHTCPVCKAGCTKDKLIPIYGRGQEAKDPRTNIPNRPSAQRPEPPRYQHNPNVQQQFNPFFGGPFVQHSFAGGQIHFSAGLFPNIFGMQFQQGPVDPNAQGPDAAQQAFISRVLFIFGTLVLFFLLLF